MSYREPGAYLDVKNNTRGASTGNTRMFPLIIGGGASKLRKTATVVRAVGTVDIVPLSNIVSIEKISEVEGGPAKWTEMTDYTVEPSDGRITWMEESGPRAGEAYYVTAVCSPSEDQFKLNLCNSSQQVVDIYGPDITDLDGNSINRVSLGAQLALESGASNVYVLQVRTLSSQPAASDYKRALDEFAQHESSIWRIIPMDLTPEIINVVNGHINQCSEPEERKERTALIGTPYTPDQEEPTQFNGLGGVLDVVGRYAESLRTRRIACVYPDVADRQLSDGTTRDLDAPFILCAFAGAEMTQPTGMSRTRMSLGGFRNLKGVRMNRAEKNMLAEKGVLILEQQTSGAPLVCRHQLTTDMSNVQSREMSIVEIQDYCSKYLRNVCEQYIGKHNITSELINMINATLKGALGQLVRDGVITGYKLGDMYQDENNPDTIIVSLSVAPPYPCNYIDITLFLE